MFEQVGCGDGREGHIGEPRRAELLYCQLQGAQEGARVVLPGFAEALEETSLNVYAGRMGAEFLDSYILRRTIEGLLHDGTASFKLIEGVD